MNPDTLRTTVWEEMLGADTRASYFAELTRYYLLMDRWICGGTLVASLSTIMAVIGGPSFLVRVVLSLTATALGFWQLTGQYSAMSRDASTLHAGWSAAHRDYERLWNHLEDPNAEATLNQIYDRAEGLSKSAGKFPVKNGRLSYWMKHSVDMAMNRYA